MKCSRWDEIHGSGIKVLRYVGDAQRWDDKYKNEMGREMHRGGMKSPRWDELPSPYRSCVLGNRFFFLGPG